MERSEMLISIFQFYVRNPKLLKRSISYHKAELLRRCESGRERGDKGVTYLGEDFSFRDFSDNEIIAFIERRLTDEFKEKHFGGIGEIGNFHENAIFEISVIKDNAMFMTGDHPVVMEDYLSQSEYPLSRSKRFYLPLNRKIALTLYHDKRKRKDRIYRCYIPDGSAAIINNLIVAQSYRFVISNKSELDWHFKFHRDFLDNTSTELKIDTIRQILSKFPETLENKPAHDIMKKYLAMYENKGFLTNEEEAALVISLNKGKAEHIRSII